MRITSSSSNSAPDANPAPSKRRYEATDRSRHDRARRRLRLQALRRCLDARYTPHNYQAQATEFTETHPQSAVFLASVWARPVITLTAVWNLPLDSFLVRRGVDYRPVTGCS